MIISQFCFLYFYFNLQKAKVCVLHSSTVWGGGESWADRCNKVEPNKKKI